jgi:hypothetical protein
MGTDLSVVIPSRGRPESVERMAIAFAETGADELVVGWAVERDDPRLPDYAEAIGRWFAYGELVEVSGGTMTAAINVASVTAAGDLDPYAIAVLNDDHLPRTPGWHTAMLDALLRLDPIGLVYPDDGLRGEGLATVWAVHAAWVKTIGRMIPARVDHLYADNAMMDLARLVGDRVEYLPDVLIEHMHPLAGKAETDEGYERVNGREALRADRARFRVWQGSRRRLNQRAALREVIDRG